jgi:O-antigen/teichoic acid export membrane protein
MNGFELAPTRRLTVRPRLSPASWILIGSVAAGGLNYMYALAMTALLAPPQYSTFAGGQAIMLITGTVANTSVPWLLAREISRARERSQVRTVVWFAVMLNFAVGIGAAALTVGLAAGFADLATVAWLGAATFSFFVASTGMGWALGRDRLLLLAGLIVAEVAIKAALGLALVAAGAGPAGAFAATMGGALAITIYMLVVMRGDLRPRIALGSRHLWRSAVGMGGVQAAVTLLSVIDVLFVSLRFGGTRTGAAYQVAATLTRAPLFLALAFATAAFPRLARRPGDRAVLSAHTKHVLGVLVPVLAVIATLPGPVLTALLPRDYVGAARFLPLTAAISTCYGLVVLQTTVFRADGRTRECLATLAGACAVSLAGMAVGATFGVYWLAVGALTGAITAVAALAVQTERRWPGAQRPDVRTLLPWPAVCAVLIVTRPVPWLWLCLASVVSVQIVRAALASPDRATALNAR